MSRRGDDEFFPEEDDDCEFYNCTVVRESEKAILVAFDPRTFGNEEHWIPLSQIKDRSKVKGGIDTGTLVITRWLAEQKGLA